MNEAYLVSLRTLQKLRFQYIPMEFRQDLTGGYNGVVVIGKNLPDQNQTVNEDRLHFQLDFHADQENRKDVRDKCNFLRSLKYAPSPNETAGKVRLIFGEMFKEHIWIVERVLVRYTQFNKKRGLLAQQAHVDITLTLAPDFYIVDDDIRIAR